MSKHIAGKMPAVAKAERITFDWTWKMAGAEFIKLRQINLGRDLLPR